MNRDQWAVWANSLKPGDKVIIQSGSSVFLDVVKKLTPTGWIVTQKHGTYSQSRWCDRYSERGGYKDVLPWTEDLEAKAKKQEEEYLREQEISRIIQIAKNVAYDWAYSKREVDYELAQKILALAEVKS